jgi:hypothetical protein
LDQLQLSRPRTWGACWLGDQLWRELQLDTFFAPRLGCSREGTDWEKVLRLLTLYRLLSPGSEWRLHRHWFGTTAMADLLGVDDHQAQDDTLYRGLDGLLEHKDALFAHLRGRWSDLFGANFDVLLYDLTSTYFECDVPADESDPRRLVTAGTSAPTACKWSWRWSSRPKACLWLTRCSPATPLTRPRCVACWPSFKSVRAAPRASG